MAILKVAQGNKIHTVLIKKKVFLPACFVLKTLEKSDVLFPFTVAALTLNLYGQHSSKPVTDSICVSNPEI